jgi:O-antigen/teichoic acid export membrane protein
MSSLITETIGEAPPTGFATKSAFSFAGQVVAFASNLTVGILLARLLGTEGKGTYALIASTAAIAASFVTLGMPFAVTFHIGRHKWPPVRTFLLGSACALVPLLLLLAVMQVVGPERVLRKAAFSPEVIRLTWLMLALGLPLQALSSMAGGVLRGRELIVETVWPGMVTSIVRMALVAGLLLLVRREVMSVVFADLAVGALGTFLIGLVFYTALRGWPSAPVKPSLARLVSYGLQIQAGSVLFILWLQGDLYFVNYFLGESAVGLYSVAMAFAEFASFPTLAITSVLFPRLALSNSADRLDQTLRTHRAVALLSAATGLILAGACFLIPVAYGSSFTPSIVPALICLGGCVLWAEIRVLYYFSMAEERVWVQAAVLVVGLVCMVSLDLLLIPVLGISGAALAYASSLVVTYAFSLWLCFRFSLLKDARALVPRRQDLLDLVWAVRSASGLGRRSAK